jgi:hypothetical protein
MGGCSCNTTAGADPFSTSGFLMLALTLSTTALRGRRRAMQWRPPDRAREISLNRDARHDAVCESTFL